MNYKKYVILKMTEDDYLDLIFMAESSKRDVYALNLQDAVEYAEENGFIEGARYFARLTSTKYNLPEGEN